MSLLPPSPGIPDKRPPAPSLSGQNYAYLQQYIRAESGIVIDEDKQYLLETRLLPVAKKHGLLSLDSLSAALSARSIPGLGVSVIEAMTTNETLFFRDDSLFEALRTTVLPLLLQRLRGTRRLRIWSAAASSGQEAYSLAMMLSEMGQTSADVEIVGTDLATHVLDRARKGVYGQFEISRGLPSSYLSRFFSQVGAEWEIKEQVRRLVRFQQFDLRQDPRALGVFDLILCRNVLIYFDTVTKAAILQSLRQQMAPSGLLVLGCAETIINVHTGFRREIFGQAAFYRQTEATNLPIGSDRSRLPEAKGK